jgi:hypothetical protein
MLLCGVWSSVSVKDSVKFGARPASIQCGVECESSEEAGGETITPLKVDQSQIFCPPISHTFIHRN